MPPKSSPKKRSAVVSSSDVEETLRRHNHPVKRKLLRPKSPSPVPETDVGESDLDDAESVVDEGTESGAQDESGGFNSADDSMGEFIDDTSALGTDGEEDPPMGIIPVKAKSTKVEVVMQRAAHVKTSNTSRGDTSTRKVIPVKVKAQNKFDTLSDDDSVVDKIVTGRSTGKSVVTTSAKSSSLKPKSKVRKADMYPEATPSKKIVSKKRALVVTPPLRTRASAGKTVLGSPMEESPTKKVRIAKEPRTPQRNASASMPKSRKANIGSEDDDNESPDQPQTPKRKTTAFTLKSKARHATEDDDNETINPFQDGDSVKAIVYQQDLTTLTVKQLPKVCEVDDENLHDPLLAKRKLYKGLPNLLQCELRGTSVFSGRNQGRFMFSAWLEICPNFNTRTAINIMAFTQEERFVNPSRVSPLILEARLINGNRYELVTLGQTALCVSLICLTDSYIHESPPNLKHPFHAIKGSYHTQEQERFGAAMGMVTGQRVLTIQTWNDQVTFQTRTTVADSSFTSNKMGDSLPASCFNTYTSPIKSKPPPRPATSPGSVLTALDFDQPIPVYDAREAKDNYKWSADVFKELEVLFPRWDGEIPKHSCVIVGYIINFTSPVTAKSDWRAYHNIQWAIMLASPPS